MRNKLPDPPGTRFGMLVIIRQAGGVKTTNGTARQYLCQCDCGNTKVISSGSLRAGKSESCGCLRRKLASQRAMRHGHSIGGIRTAEHSAWHQMRQRCQNKKNPKYKAYGGRGITVCKRWERFESFFADMGEKPSPQHSLGRIDNHGPYSPKNCQWETPAEQGSNQRSNHLLTFQGRTQTISQWAKELGIKYLTLFMRIKRGWSTELAMTTRVEIGQKIR